MLNRLVEPDSIDFLAREDILVSPRGNVDTEAPFHPVLLAAVVISPLLMIALVLGIVLILAR
jgi:hypothetical protein